MSDNQQGAIGGTAYGSGKAGAPFDPLVYIKKPQVILRIVSLVFSVIVFGCISSLGYYKTVCIMNNDNNVCGYGVGVGVIAFLLLVGFLLLDALFDNLSSVQHRKYAVIVDLVASALLTFLWFVGFCYMTDAWRQTPSSPAIRSGINRGRDNIQAAITFSFFSIFTWGATTFLAVRRYRLGAADAFTTGYDPDPNASSPYSSFPGSDTGDPYQQPPFSQQKEVPDYQAPTY